MGIEKCLRGLSVMLVTKRRNGKIRAVDRAVNYIIDGILGTIVSSREKTV